MDLADVDTALAADSQLRLIAAYAARRVGHLVTEDPDRSAQRVLDVLVDEANEVQAGVGRNDRS